MSKRVFVTGAAGFIGFHVAKALHERGDVVIGCDNFNPYYDPALKKARASLLSKNGIEVHSIDLKEREELEKLIEKVYPTHILHLAAQAGVRASLFQPQAYIDANITGFLNILEIVRQRVDVPLVYASSSSVYGHNEKVPFSETDRLDQPASLYAVTKRCGEEMAYVYHHLFGLKATGLRFFTVYGEWGRPDMAYFSFVKKILEGHPIELFNHGQMERDFTYISDIVDGTIRALDLEAPLEIFNLGNHRPTPLKRFVEIIELATGKIANISYLPMQQGDVTRTFAAIDHSQHRLGFTPKTPLEIGIPRFVDWYRTYYNVR
jgi:UDP-glucuronate 4-epimerase